MKKYYRMAVENIKTGEHDTYVSEKQGAAPPGWKCTGVCGSFDLPNGEKFDGTLQHRRFADRRIRDKQYYS